MRPRFPDFNTVLHHKLSLINSLIILRLLIPFFYNGILPVFVGIQYKQKRMDGDQNG